MFDNNCKFSLLTVFLLLSFNPIYCDDEGVGDPNKIDSINDDEWKKR